MAKRKSAGGPAAIGGFAFQHSLTAWVAVGVLAETASSPRWDLPSSAFFKFFRCETEQPLDDLMIGTSTGGLVLLQISTNISRSADADSKLSSSIEQAVKQVRAYRTGVVQPKPWERTLDPLEDRLVLASDEDAPVWFRVSLPLLLSRFRADASATSLVQLARNEDDKTTATILEGHFARIWATQSGCAPTAAETRHFFSLLHVDHFNLTSNGRDRLAAVNSLRESVLDTPKYAETCWTVIESYCQKLAQHRDGADRPALHDMLRKASPALHIRAARSFTNDIAKLRSLSQQMIVDLRDLAEMRERSTQQVIKIQRAAAKALQATAIQGENCLVVGEPGAGKSGIVNDVAAALSQLGTDIVYLAADRIGATTEFELRSEFQLDHKITDILLNWPGTAPGLVIIDALDAARSDHAAKLFRELIKYIVDAKGRWRVIASIRKFDLRYGKQLQLQFAGEPVANPLPDPEFPRVKHLSVSLLRDEELDEVNAQSERLCGLIERARQQPGSSLLDLLRSPFNLNLASELIELGVRIDAIAVLQSRIELLELYWSRRLDGGGPEAHATELACSAICEQMIDTKSLVADATRVPPQFSNHVHDLKANGVLIEWQRHSQALPDQSILAFAHNVLCDYAIARTHLRGVGNKINELLSSDNSMLLAFRPSLEMHFHFLWSRDGTRQQFWAYVFEGQRANIPQIGKLVGPAVAADVANSTSDLIPLFDAVKSLDNEVKAAAENCIKHIAGSLLATKQPKDIAKSLVWTTFIRLLAENLSDATIGALRALLLSITVVDMQSKHGS